MDPALERALEAFDEVFQENGFNSSPPGLRHLLRRLAKKPCENAEEARRRFYRRIFGILWFGNKIGNGQFSGKTLPTYVYPGGLKNVVREILDTNLRDYPDPEDAAVYKVTLQDLSGAKWPAVR